MLLHEETTKDTTSSEGQPPHGVTYKALFHLLAIPALSSRR
jgi:hypothetical protein